MSLTDEKFRPLHDVKVGEPAKSQGLQDLFASLYISQVFKSHLTFLLLLFYVI